MRRGKAWAGLVAGTIALLIAILYLVIIHNQGDASAVVPWVFSAIALASLAAFSGWLLSPGRKASLLLSGAAVLLFVLGVLGIFSVGIPLLLAGVFSVVGVAQARVIRRPAP
jgi:hypothetical protein